MSNSDLNQVKIFTAVAEQQSFTKAAKMLEIEKSTVSLKVSQLEQRLGVKLLQRTTRKVNLTEAGRHYLNYCVEALKQIDQGEMYLESLNQEPQGKLRISTPYNLVDVLMKSVFPTFLSNNPKVDLEIIQTNHKVDLINDNFDIAIRSTDDNLTDSSLIYRKLHHSDWVIVASQQYLTDKPEIDSVEQLINLDYIAMINETDLGYQLQSPFLSSPHAKIKLTPRLSTNNGGNVIQAVYQDLGFAIVPKGMVTSAINDGTLVQLLPQIEIPSSSLYLVYPSRTGQPAKVSAFVEMMVEWAESMKQPHGKLWKAPTG